ncbi:hypothetical protein Bca4012_083406 [Brassica carinata]
MAMLTSSSGILAYGTYYVNVLDGIIYVATGAKHLVYDLKENRWDEEESNWSLNLDKSPACVTDDVLYRYNNGWLSNVGLSAFNVNSEDYAGKMAFLWNSFGTEETWCAEIALERRNEHGMWGKIEWFGIALLKSTWIH